MVGLQRAAGGEPHAAGTIGARVVEQQLGAVAARPSQQRLDRRPGADHVRLRLVQGEGEVGGLDVLEQLAHGVGREPLAGSADLLQPLLHRRLHAAL